VGPFRPIFAYFGYDEPNYTYSANGRRLISELAALSSTPVYIRTHFLLTTGDGTPRLKWGSTNAYTEDSSGRPVYNWAILDRIFDTYLHADARPFVEIGFMPEALSSHPAPYEPVWSPGAAFDRYYAGWSYPPKDYGRWAELIRQWVTHWLARYGPAPVASWYWEVWNEPDGGYWHGSAQECNKLYDYTVDAIKRLVPTARVGGPATVQCPSRRFPAAVPHTLRPRRQLRQGSTGAPLDFISYHAKGRPSVLDGHVRMGLSKNAADVNQGFQIVAAFPKFREIPIILSESDPEGCTACSARVYPQNAYRDGALYPAYTAVMLKMIFELASRARVNIEGMLTWAFEFEDQPYFDGFRTLATNGVDKPVLNLFRMAGLMRGAQIRVDSSAAIPLDTLLAQGAAAEPDIDGLAVRSDHTLSLLAWNYQDDDTAAPDAEIRLRVRGLPAGRMLLRH
jgi:xylan 1,4-beta-xylosidase